jgi:hypothetical protein
MYLYMHLGTIATPIVPSVDQKTAVANPICFAEVQ